MRSTTDIYFKNYLTFCIENFTIEYHKVMLVMGKDHTEQSSTTEIEQFALCKRYTST